jgi:hypothetical protein
VPFIAGLFYSEEFCSAPWARADAVRRMLLSRQKDPRALLEALVPLVKLHGDEVEIFFELPPADGGTTSGNGGLVPTLQRIVIFAFATLAQAEGRKNLKHRGHAEMSAPVFIPRPARQHPPAF